MERQRQRQRPCSFASLRRNRRAINKAAGRNGGRPLQEWRKLLRIALARYTVATVLSARGHKALRGRDVVRSSLVFSIAPFGTEPLLVNTKSKTETETGTANTHTLTDMGHLTFSRFPAALLRWILPLLVLAYRGTLFCYF